MRRSLPALLAIVLVSAPLVASAQIYKWTDAQGTTHFSEMAPRGVKYEVIRTRPDADQPRMSEKGAVKEQDSQASKGSGNARSIQLQRFCDQLQSNITLLESKQSLQRMDSNGKTVQVDAKLRAQQLKQQKQRYEAYCSK